MQEGYVYLSQPYNGTPAEMTYRVEMATQITLQCILNEICIFSPIAHNHAVLQAAERITLEQRRDKFLKYDLKMLSNAHAMAVLMLPGWQKSYGVQVEIDYCQVNSIEIIYTTPERILDDINLIAVAR